MRQTFHIFKKDVRQLRYEIAMAILVAALYAAIESSAARSGALPTSWASSLILYLLPLAGWVVIARAIQAEALPGDRQFWITRPYRRGSLLAAKLLFILLFVNLPLLAADLIIVLAYGFRPAAIVPGLLWRQVLLTGAFVLPMAAIATVTATFVEMMLVFLGVLVISVAPDYLLGGAAHRSWYPWIVVTLSIAFLSLAAVLCIVWQYARRRTGINRGVIAAAFLVTVFGFPMLPMSGIYRIQSAFSSRRVDSSRLQVSLDTGRSWLGTIARDASGRVHVELPVRITGTPPGLVPVYDGMTLEIEAPGGRVWRSGKGRDARVTSSNTVTSIETWLPQSFYSEVRNKPARLRGHLFVTFKGDPAEASVPMGGGPTPVPGGGVCSAGEGRDMETYHIVCWFAFRQPPGWLSVRFRQDGTMYSPPPSYSPFPADFELSPVSQVFGSEFLVAVGSGVVQRPPDVKAARLVLTRPVAHVERDFELDDVTLASYDRAVVWPGSGKSANVR